MNEIQLDEKECLESFFTSDELTFLLPNNNDYVATMRIIVPREDITDITDKELKKLEIELVFHWPKTYPDVLPLLDINVDHKKYWNRDVQTFKDNILTEGQEFIGDGMVIMLVEYAKEIMQDVLKPVQKSDLIGNTGDTIVKKKQKKSSKGEKKIKLTKTQKNALLKHQDAEGNYIRGWDWVDVISHLQKT